MGNNPTGPEALDARGYAGKLAAARETNGQNIPLGEMSMISGNAAA